MKTRYRLIRRGNRSGAFYCVDTKTGKRTSLAVRDKDAAYQVIAAKNQAERQPMLNLQIAKAYLAGTDSGVATRTWQNALDVLAASKHGDNERRWRSASNDPAFDLLRHQVIIETRGETLLRVLRNRFHKHLPAATSQLLFGHELASLADHSETPVASIQVQGETRRHLGGGTRRL